MSMTERIKKLKAALENREHRVHRRKLTEEELSVILPQIRNRALTYMERHTLRLKLFLELEQPVLLPGTEVYGLRTIEYFPDIYTLTMLAYTVSWRNADSVSLLARSLNRINRIMKPDTEIHVSYSFTP